jgi:hypothetical protein
MIYSFPHHDPDGRFNEPFSRLLDDIMAAFDQVCIGVSPSTAEHNGAFVRHLGERGCGLAYNGPGSPPGDHFRSALRLAALRAQCAECIFYGMIDRVLYAMDTHWKQTFLHDLAAHQDRPFVIYDRTPTAWDTHPANYREIEHMVSRAGKWLYGEYLELGLCAITLGAEVAQDIVEQSVGRSFEVLGEFVLLAIANDIPIAIKAVDWLPWEDPYWEGIDPQVFRRIREESRDETAKRINMMAPFMLMLAEERFRDLKPRVERLR